MANRITVIKEFFEKPTEAFPAPRKLDMSELRALTAGDRQELAELAAKELGVELD